MIRLIGKFFAWAFAPVSMCAARFVLDAPKGWTVCRVIHAAKGECPVCLRIVRKFSGHFKRYDRTEDDNAWFISGDVGVYRGCPDEFGEDSSMVAGDPVGYGSDGGEAFGGWAEGTSRRRRQQTRHGLVHRAKPPGPSA